jgi:molybdopterin-guanine dinucleotide biosynthesis protein A
MLGFKPSMNREITALVLAGGKSSRMGRDKTMLPLAGQTMLTRACEFGRAVCGTVLVAVGSADHFDALPDGCVAVCDAEPGLGPLAGLCAGLAAARTEFALVYAVDMPFLSAEAVQQLADGIGSADVCLFRSHGKVEPLFALYRCGCLPTAQACLFGGVRRMRDLIERLDAVVLDAPEDTLFQNCNTPEEYEAARRQVE